MKATINADEFKAKVAALSRVIGTMGMSSSIKVSADDRLRFFAFNDYCYVTTSVSAKVHNTGSMVVGGDYLSKYASKVSGKGVIEVSTDSKSLLMVHGSTKTNFSETLMSSVYPKEPQAPSFDEYSRAEFINGLGSVTNMTTKDEVRPVLQAICLNFQNDRLSMFATDGYRVGYNKLPPIASISGKSFNLPGAVVPIIKTMQGTNIKLGMLNDEFYLSDWDTSIYVKCIYGDYPNLAKIIPKGGSGEFEIVGSELIELLALGGMFDDNSSVKISLDGDVLSLAGVGTEGKHESSVVGKGTGSGQLYVNASYVTSVCSAIAKKEKIVIGFGDTLTVKYNNFVGIVMPMNVI